jgi:hypothetical protein
MRETGLLWAGGDPQPDIDRLAGEGMQNEQTN